jgi:dephospho-CoA kinase
LGTEALRLTGRKMLVVGLTGGIASGKSTVSTMMRQAGIPVICADELARLAVSAGSSCLEQIRGALGDGVVGDDGELDRKAVAAIVFADSSKRELIESIIHPWVLAETARRLGQLVAEGYNVAVVDVPLLYEAGWEDGFDLVMVVYVPREVQRTRLVERDQVSEDDAEARLRAQKPIEEKRARANIVIDNSGTIESTREQVERALAAIRQMSHNGLC